MSEENGKISLINFEGQEVIFDSIEDVYEKFIKIKNEKIWAPYHNTFTRIFVELTVEYIINACECVPIQTSIEFLRKSISHIQKEQSLDKYARRKLNDHLKYYKTILQISLKDTTGNKKLYKGEHLYSAIVQNNKLFLLQKQLNDLNFDTFFSLIKSIYASIPYNLISSKESYFHSIFHVITVLLIQSIKSEELTSLGRIDSIIELNEKVFIFEFKLNDINQAIEQIRERRYYEKYQQLNKIIFMIGVSFDSKTKNIKEWRVEKI